MRALNFRALASRFVAVMVVLGGVGGALAGGPYMGLGERFNFAIKAWAVILFALMIYLIVQ